MSDMLSVKEAVSKIEEAYPKSKINNVAETENYYIFDLNTSSRHGKEAVDKETGKVTILNVLQLSYEFGTEEARVLSVEEWGGDNDRSNN